MQETVGIQPRSLSRSHGRTGDPSDPLIPDFGWFTEGFDTADLKEAKALFEELS